MPRIDVDGRFMDIFIRVAAVLLAACITVALVLALTG